MNKEMLTLEKDEIVWIVAQDIEIAVCAHCGSSYTKSARHYVTQGIIVDIEDSVYENDYKGKVCVRQFGNCTLDWYLPEQIWKMDPAGAIAAAKRLNNEA